MGAHINTTAATTTSRPTLQGCYPDYSSCKMSKTEEDLDDVLKRIGQFGRYQIYIYLLLSLPALFSGIVSITYVFSAAELPYRCRIPECDVESPDFEPPWLSNVVPMQSKNGDLQPDGCHRYQGIQKLGNGTCLASSNQTETCESWVFGGDATSIQSDFGVTCENSVWKLSFVGTLNSIGQFVGLPVMGAFSDRFGRKKVLIVCLVMTGIIGLARSFSPNYVAFAASEFTTMLFGGSMMFGIVFILALELVGPDKRDLGGVVINCLESTGQVLMGLLGWWIRSWRAFILASHVPGIMFLVYAWLLPESVRWLMANGRVKEAEAILRKAAATNGKTLTEVNLKVPDKDKENGVPKESAYRAVLRSKTILLRLLNCIFCWITNVLVYYGLSLNSVSLGSDRYTSFVLVCLVELPAYIFVYVLIRRLGRRLTLCSTLLLSGICCLVVIAVPKDLEWLSITIYMIGKLSITVAFTAIYFYTAEVFPTQLRNSLLATCSMFGRIGTLIAPLTPALAQYLESLPLILFGVMSITSGLLTALLPETKDVKLPDTVHESERIGANADPEQ